MTRKRTRTDGKFRFAFTATKAGRAKYRVVAPAAAGRAKGISNTVRIDTYRWRYISDMDWHEDGDWDNGAVNIAGKRYAESVYADNIFWGDLEVNLNGKCTELRGAAGLTDDSDTGSTGALSVLQDGSEIFYTELDMTTAHDLELDISGALRLAFRNYDLEENNGEFPWVGVGNARAYCRS